MLKRLIYYIQDYMYIFVLSIENFITKVRIWIGNVSDYYRIDRTYNINTQTVPDTTYIPISTKVFQLIMKNIDTDGDISFLDYGSGKGKALILAAENGIQNVSGIEFENSLIEICNDNLNNYAIKRQITTKFNVMYGDATKLKDIDYYNMFFINNSFGGNPSEERLVAKILKNIETSLEARPRHINLIYVHPCISLQKMFDAYGWLNNKKVIVNKYRPKTERAYIYIFSIN